MLPPGAPEFSAWFSQFRRSCFRIETLQCYGGSGETDSIETFLAGDTPAPHPGKREWMQLVSAAVRAGKVMQRVHVVTEPVTDYMTFELAWSYAYNVAAGEDVRIIPLSEDEGWPSGIPRDGRDFWLFDESELFRLHYNQDGTWLGVEHVENRHWVTIANAQRRYALELAQPWLKYINNRPELARRVPDVQWPN